MLASYASTATQAYNQQSDVRVCESYQSVTDVKLSISSCAPPSRVYLYTLPLFLYAASFSDSTRSYKLTYMLAS